MANEKIIDLDRLALYDTQIKALIGTKVDKVEGKGLSTNDLTNELVTKINNAGSSTFNGDYESLTSKPTVNGVALTGNKTTADLGITVPTATSEITNDSGYQTSTDVDAKISALVGGAPAALDTLKEIADALADDDSAIAALTTTVGNKVDKSAIAYATNADINALFA